MEKSKYSFWSQEETDALRAGVRKHGKGNWMKIINDEDFKILLIAPRSNVDLKDRWRVIPEGQEDDNITDTPSPSGNDKRKYMKTSIGANYQEHSADQSANVANRRRLNDKLSPLVEHYRVNKNPSREEIESFAREIKAPTPEVAEWFFNRGLDELSESRDLIKAQKKILKEKFQEQILASQGIGTIYKDVTQKQATILRSIADFYKIQLVEAEAIDKILPKTDKSARGPEDNELIFQPVEKSIEGSEDEQLVLQPLQNLKSPTNLCFMSSIAQALRVCHPLRDFILSLVKQKGLKELAKFPALKAMIDFIFVGSSSESDSLLLIASTFNDVLEFTPNIKDNTEGWEKQEDAATFLLSLLNQMYDEVRMLDIANNDRMKPDDVKMHPVLTVNISHGNTTHWKLR